MRPTDVRDQKIYNTTLDIYRIVIAVFLVTDKANQIRFFEKIFLLANISPKIVFRRLFLTLNNINIDFPD